MLMVQNPLAGHMEVAAWFFRDHHGGFMAGATHFSPSLCDVERAELLACRWAVKLAAKVGASKLMLESNCMGRCPS
jgi:hypothetical protein